MRIKGKPLAKKDQSLLLKSQKEVYNHLILIRQKDKELNNVACKNVPFLMPKECVKCSHYILKIHHAYSFLVNSIGFDA